MRVLHSSICYLHERTHTHKYGGDSSPEANLPCCPMLQRHQMDYEFTSDIPAGSKGIHFSTDQTVKRKSFILLINEKRLLMHPSWPPCSAASERAVSGMIAIRQRPSKTIQPYGSRDKCEALWRLAQRAMQSCRWFGLCLMQSGRWVRYRSNV